MIEKIRDKHWICLDFSRDVVISGLHISAATDEEDAFPIIVYGTSDCLKWDCIHSQNVKVSYKESINIFVDIPNYRCRFIYIKHLSSEKTNISCSANVNPLLIPFRNIIVVHSDLYYESLLNSLWRNTYENSEINLCLEHIGENETVLELGASMGGVSSVVLKNKHVKRYVCVEANPDLVHVMQKNHSINGVTAEIRNAAVVGQKCQEFMKFYVRDNFLGSSISDTLSYTKEYDVPVVAFSDLLEEVEPTFICCDIEGAEFEAFQNIDLKSVRKICVELHYPDVNDVKRFFDYMAEQNFTLISGERNFSLVSVCMFSRV